MHTLNKQIKDKENESIMLLKRAKKKQQIYLNGKSRIFQMTTIH